MVNRTALPLLVAVILATALVSSRMEASAGNVSESSQALGDLVSDMQG